MVFNQIKRRILKESFLEKRFSQTLFQKIITITVNAYNAMRYKHLP